MSSFLRHPKYYNKNFTSFLPSIRTSEKKHKIWWQKDQQERIL